MAKTHYTDYIARAMRFYIRYKKPDFKSDTDQANWYTCEEALREFPPDEQEMITFVYESDLKIKESIVCLAKMKKIKQNRLWNIIANFEKRVAKIRGLI